MLGLLLPGCGGKGDGYRPHIVDGWGYDLRQVGARHAIPPIEALDGDVVRIWAFELFGGELTELYDLHLDDGSLDVRTFGWQDGERHVDQRTVAPFPELAQLLATGIHEREGIHESDVGDGSEYHIETRIDGRYRYALYNNPGLVPTIEAQLVARTITILEGSLDEPPGTTSRPDR